MGLGLALRAFWTALSDKAAAERMALALDNPTAGLPEPAAVEPAAPAPASPERVAADQNAAVTLLATLQRDARLVDLIREDLDPYSDEQVGAAARPCLKQCRQTLDRVLPIEPLLEGREGDSVEVASDVSPARYRWLGESAAAQPAKLVHPGWQVRQVDLPKWTGEKDDAMVVAPAQVSAS